MGMDAYALTPDGRRLRTVGEFPSIRLEDDRFALAFKMAEKTLCASEPWVDAGLAHGSLCISANSSAVNHLLWFYSARPDSEGRYSPASVTLVASKMRARWPIPDDLPAYVRSDKSAMRHAIVFILACASLGMAIDISP